MPPKKAAGAAQTTKAVTKKSQANGRQVPDRTKAEEKNNDNNKKEEVEEEEEQPVEDEKLRASKKRKSPPTSAAKDKPRKKEPRQGGRTSGRQAGGGAGKDATSKQIINFLLSKEALPYCFPSDELDAAQSGKFKKCYSLTPPSLFTPYEHLVTAHLLSKPLSHTLGMRSVRTLLNEPYSFSTPGKMRAAGEDKIWQALEDAKTQHRQKTASYLYELAVQYADPDSKGDDGDMGDSDEMLELATEANEGGPRSTIEHIKKSVKGMGETGAQIFARRVQACEGWGEAIWPYADPRAIDALRECGIKVADAEDLQEMIERDVDFDKVGDMGMLNEKEGVDDKDHELQTAVEFVTVLERAIGASLEKNISELKRAAAEYAK